MTTRFTRLSIVAGDRQIDVSLPAARPIGEYLPELPSLFGIPVGNPPEEWVLSTTRHGIVRDAHTLEDAGVLDGDLLYLTAQVDAAIPPVVDDVIATVSAVRDDHTPPWAGRARDWGVTSLLATAVAPLGAALAVLPDERLSGIALLVTFAVVVVLAGFLRARGGQVLAWTGVPLAFVGALRLVHTAGPDVRLVAAVAVAAGAVAAVGVAVRLAPAVAVAGVLAGVLAGATSGLLVAGIDATALAAWASIGLVLVLGVLPQVSMSISGLVRLVRDAEAGEGAPRSAVARAMRIAGAATDGVAVGLALTGAAAVSTLVILGRPAQEWLGGLVALIFLLRSRGFSQALHVAALLFVPLAGLAALAFALPRLLDVPGATGAVWTWAGGTALAAVIVAACGYVRLPEVTGARLSRLYDRVDMFAVIALVPVVLLAQNVFSWISDQV